MKNKGIFIRNSFVLVLCFILVSGALFLISCKKKAVAPTQQPPALQARVDLRETDAIELSAEDFNLSAIKKVGLLPKHMKKDIDYRVEIAGGGQSANVILRNKEKFHLARIVLYLK